MPWLGRLCAAALGTITVTTRAVPIATGITPTTATTTWVFGWGCPTFFPPFFWFRRQAGWRAGVPRRPRSGNAGRSARAGLPAEAKEEEQRQTVWSARIARAAPGASPAPDAYSSQGTARPARPPCPPPPATSPGSAGILAGSFLKPAGWKPAPHGAPGFHAFVETTAIRAPQRVTRRAEKRSAFRQTHTPNLIPLRSPAASSTTSSPPQSGEIHPLHDPTVERGARPIRLLHRIDVDVIHMGRVVLLVADRMFPESPLPDAALALGGADRRSPFGPRQGLGEGDLDRLPAGRVVRVIGWHVQTACIWSGNMTQARCGRDGRRAPS